MASSRKGCMRGKGGPNSALCKHRGVRQRTWGKWAAEIREPNRSTRLWLGTFNTSTEVVATYEETTTKLYSPSATLNLPKPDHPSDSNGPSSVPGCDPVPTASGAISRGAWDKGRLMVPDWRNGEEWGSAYDCEGGMMRSWTEFTYGGCGLPGQG